MPRDRDALQALPGVGRKTANVVLNVAFGEPTIAVDTHVFRVANRTGLARGRDAARRSRRRWWSARRSAGCSHAHHWLILHGRYVCMARKPRCPVCVIRDICRFEAKSDGADLVGERRAFPLLS